MVAVLYFSVFYTYTIMGWLVPRRDKGELLDVILLLHVLLVLQSHTAPFAGGGGTSFVECVVLLPTALGLLGVGVELLQLRLHLRVPVEDVLGNLELRPHKRVDDGGVGVVLKPVVVKRQVLVDVHENLWARLLRLGLDRRQQRVVSLVELVQEHVPGLEVHRAGHLVHRAEPLPQLQRLARLSASQRAISVAALALSGLHSAGGTPLPRLHTLLLLLLYGLVELLLHLLCLRLQKLGSRRRAGLEPDGRRSRRRHRSSETQNCFRSKWCKHVCVCCCTSVLCFPMTARLLPLPSFFFFLRPSLWSKGKRNPSGTLLPQGKCLSRGEKTISRTASENGLATPSEKLLDHM